MAAVAPITPKKGDRAETKIRAGESSDIFKMLESENNSLEYVR